MEDLTAFVLAGGKSSRMGCDKALVELGGRTLLERTLGLASEVASGVRVVGDPVKYGSFGALVADVYPERGPLGGIHAALVSTNTDLNLVLATDLPFLQMKFLRFLIATARANEALVTVPQLGRYFEPLCAVYRKEFASVAAAALAKGENKVDALFTEPVTRTISEQEMRGAGFSASIFRNLNSPNDVVRAQREFS
jgi:molybdopterin-guanine dinucleotide biosynthesis protein A